MTGGDAMQETGQLRGYLKTADVTAAIGGDGGGVQQSTCTRVAPRNKSNARNMRCRLCFFLFGNSESLCVVAPVLVSQLMMDGEKSLGSLAKGRGQIWVSKFDDLDPSTGLISAKSRTGK